MPHSDCSLYRVDQLNYIFIHMMVIRRIKQDKRSAWNVRAAGFSLYSQCYPYHREPNGYNGRLLKGGYHRALAKKQLLYEKNTSFQLSRGTHLH